jgi:hypothetical protein
VLHKETEEANLTIPRLVAMNNFFVPLRDLLLKNAETGSKGNSTKTPGTNEGPGRGRPPPGVLTLEAKLISLQRELKSVVNGQFFFWNTAIGTWITTRSMVDYNTIQKFLTDKSLDFFAFHTKANKPVKANIRHLAGNISAEGISAALQEKNYDISSVKQMTAEHPTPEGGVAHTSTPLFQVMIPRKH